MNPLDQFALYRAIWHWERLRDGRGYAGEAPNTDGCALCARFYSTPAGRCVRFGLPWPPWRLSPARRRRVECPVASATGAFGCAQTPYHAAAEAFARAELIRELRGEAPSGADYDAMDHEVRFLKGLL